MTQAARNQPPDSPEYAGLNWLQTPALMLDAEDRVSFLNASAEALLGRTGRVALGAPLKDLMRPSDRISQLIERARMAGSLVERGLEFETMDRDEHTADLILNTTRHFMVVEFQLLDWHQDRVSHSRDSTLAQAHTQVLRGLAHEINNPLGGIRGAAQLITRSDNHEERERLAALIIGEVDRLGSLLDRFAENPQVNPSSVDVHRLLETTRSLVLGDREFNLDILQRDYDPSVPEISADPDLLTQALLNLTRNAAQFGARRVILRTRAEHQIALGHGVCPLALRIDVEDDGPGIEPELAELIFLPLVSSRRGGSGLGLALSQAIARAHGGLIRCRSRPGKTVFSLFLPIEVGS